jgi:hypothetical protein
LALKQRKRRKIFYNNMSGSSSIGADKMNKDVVFLIAAIHAFLVSVPSLIFSLTQASLLWAHTLMSFRNVCASRRLARQPGSELQRLSGI